MAVVQDAAKLDRRELVAQRADVAVEREALEVDVSRTQDRCARRLVAAARLDADEAVLDDVNAPNTVLAPERVQRVEDVDGVGVRFLAGGDLDGEAGLELDGNALGRGGRVLGSSGQLPHVGGRGGVGVLEDAGLVGDVEHVLIGRPGLRGGLEDGDAAFLGVGEEGLAAGEAVVEFLTLVSILRFSCGNFDSVPGRRHGAMTLMSGLRP